MKEKIIVMGGSFNPPTIAHYELMKTALETIGAVKGIFVPVSHAYLKRKMRKAEAPVCLSEQLRVQMLEALCAEDPRLEICDYELRNPLWNTPETMDALRETYPQAELYFLAGADKMRLICILSDRHAFLEKYKVAIVGREGLDPMEIIAHDPLLCMYREAFAPVKQPRGLETVSSTAIRRQFLAGEPELAKAFLHEKVWALFFRLDPRDYPPEIEKFKDAYEFLSNGFLSPVTCEGLTFRCAEAAFQALRSRNPADRHRFLRCDGGGAKSIALKVEPREDWGHVRLEVMQSVLRAKFDQNPELKEKLIQTGNSILTFGNNGKDPFWGMDLYTCTGENHLGKLLMKLRSTC